MAGLTLEEHRQVIANDRANPFTPTPYQQRAIERGFKEMFLALLTQDERAEFNTMRAGGFVNAWKRRIAEGALNTMRRTNQTYGYEDTC